MDLCTMTSPLLCLHCSSAHIIGFLWKEETPDVGGGLTWGFIGSDDFRDIGRYRGRIMNLVFNKLNVNLLQMQKRLQGSLKTYPQFQNAISCYMSNVGERIVSQEFISPPMVMGPSNVASCRPKIKQVSGPGKLVHKLSWQWFWPHPSMGNY